MADQIGRAYNLEKKPKGGNYNPKGENQHKGSKGGKRLPTSGQPTRKKVAKRFNVSERKVEEDAKFSKAVDELDKDIPGNA